MEQSSEGLLSQPQTGEHDAETKGLEKPQKLPSKEQDTKDLKQKVTLGV